MNNKPSKKRIHWNLKDVPTDVYEIIMDIQNEKKKKLKKVVSIERVIYACVRLANNVLQSKKEEGVTLPDNES